MFKRTPNNFADALRALVELDFDAIAAYKVVLAHLRSPQCQRPLRQFQSEHERHVRELSHLLLSYQEKIIQPSEVRHWLIQGPMIVSGPISDQGLLDALLALAATTNAAYQEVLGRPDRWPAAEFILMTNYFESACHHDWLEAACQRLRGRQEGNVHRGHQGKRRFKCLDGGRSKTD